MSLEDDLLKKEAALRAELDDIQNIRDLMDKYPDLRKDTGRWGKVRWCSKTVNSLVDKFYTAPTCSCCYDKGRRVYLYLEDTETRIYTDPPYREIGEELGYDSFYKHENWEEPLREMGVPETLIAQIRQKNPDWHTEEKKIFEY